MSLRFSDVFSLQMGKTPARNNPAYWGGTQNWISISDMNDKYISKTREQISDAAISETGIKLVPKGTVIMSFKLSIGKVSITAEDTYTNEAIMAFINKGIYDIDNDYLYHYLKAQDWSVGSNKAVKGSTLNKSVLEKRDISFPSKTEQQKISYKLNLADEAISRCRQIEDTLDQLVKSRFVEMFGDILCNDKGWPIYTLDTIGSSRLGKMLDAKRNTGKNSFPYLANFNVQWFEFDLSELHEMDFDDAEREEFSLNDGDLLITEGGEVGRCAIWHNEVTNCYFQKALHRVRCDKNIILPEYLAWWFKFHSDFNGFEDIVGGKATIAHLPGVKLKKLQIEVPDINVQKDFVSFWREIDKSKLAVKECLEKAEYLKSALMQEYFG